MCRTSACYPQTNSSAESFNRELMLCVLFLRSHDMSSLLNDSADEFNRELIKIMTMMIDELDDPEWETRLPNLMLAYITGLHKATNTSPLFDILKGSGDALLPDWGDGIPSMGRTGLPMPYGK